MNIQSYSCVPYLISVLSFNFNIPSTLVVAFNITLSASSVLSGIEAVTFSISGVAGTIAISHSTSSSMYVPSSVIDTIN